MMDNYWTVHVTCDFSRLPYTLMGEYKEPKVKTPTSKLDLFQLLFNDDIVFETNNYTEEKKS